MRGYQLKIVLKGIEPEIWRRIIVPCDMHMADFVWAILGAMQWEHCCKWRFFVDGKLLLPDMEETHIYDLYSLYVKDYVSREIEFWYHVFPDDEGHVDTSIDAWKHSIVFEGEVLDWDGIGAVCVDGERACPPDYVGFAKEYKEFLDVLADKEYPNREHLLSVFIAEPWSSGRYKDWDPEVFDIRSVEISTAGPKKLYVNNYW